MPCINRMMSLAVLLFCGMSFVAPLNTAAANNCQNLPPTTLEIYTIKAPTVEERKISAEQLGKSPAEDLMFRHSMMVTGSDLVAISHVRHRVVSEDNGPRCYAPERVRLGFGSSRRLAFLEHSAADDHCVRREMLNHEMVHNKVFDNTVELFIDDQRDSFQQQLKALKQTPVPGSEAAMTVWNETMQAIVLQAKEQLLTDLRIASIKVDTPASLSALEAACGGKLQLQQGSTADL